MTDATTQLASLTGGAFVAALDQLTPAEAAEVDIAGAVQRIDAGQLTADEFHRLLATLHRLASDAVLDITTVDAGAFVRLMAAVPAAYLDRVTGDRTLRGWLLDEIFRRMADHARADRIGDMHAVVRWRLTGGDGPDGHDRYTCLLAARTCTVTREDGRPTERPRVTVTLSPTNFIRLITQQDAPAVAFVTGNLKLRGDLGFAATLIGYFDLPRVTDR